MDLGFVKIDFSAQLEFSRLEFQAAITKCGTSDVALVPLGTRLSKTQMELNFHNLPPRICCENVVEVALLKKNWSTLVYSIHFGTLT